MGRGNDQRHCSSNERVLDLGFVLPSPNPHPTRTALQDLIWNRVLHMSYIKMYPECSIGDKRKHRGSKPHKDTAETAPCSSQLRIEKTGATRSQGKVKKSLVQRLQRVLAVLKL